MLHLQAQQTRIKKRHLSVRKLFYPLVRRQLDPNTSSSRKVSL